MNYMYQKRTAIFMQMQLTWVYREQVIFLSSVTKRRRLSQEPLAEGTLLTCRPQHHRIEDAQTETGSGERQRKLDLFNA